MSPTARSIADRSEDISTPARIEKSAIGLFRAQGYAGSSIREIAGGANIAIATMFHHFPSKLAILEHLLHRIVDQLQSELDASIDDSSAPAVQLGAFVQVMVLAHCSRGDESFVAESELRSLPETERAAVRAKRLRIQHRLRDIIEAGVAARDFEVNNTHSAAEAILTMCTSVPSWYRRGRALSPAGLADDYTQYALRILGYRGVDHGSPRSASL